MTQRFIEMEELRQPPRGATFSPCGTWRYRLWNHWGDTGRVLGYVGCNPSKAGSRGRDGAMRWDLTASKFDGFARRLGYGGWYATNLFGLVSTDPAGLRSFEGDPIGPENDEWIRAVANACERIVLCWGATGGVFAERAQHVIGMLAGASLWCLGRTKGGHPRHPSRLVYKTELEAWGGDR